MKKKAFFSKKGNPEDYDYMSHQVVFILVVAVLMLGVVLGVRFFGG